MKTASHNGQYGAAALVVAALGVCTLPQAQAQTQTQTQTQTQPQPVAQPRPDKSAPYPAFYAFGGFAALVPEKNSQLQGEEGSPINLIAGGGYLFSRNFAVEVNLLVGVRSLDTPATARPPVGTFAPGTLDSTMWTSGVAATVKYRFPTEQVTPYIGGGIGFYSTRFLTTSEAIGCVDHCADTGPRVDARSSDVGAHVVGGADFHFTPKDVLAVEIRYLKLKANFGALVPGGDVDVGGTFFWMGYRRYF